MPKSPLAVNVKRARTEAKMSHEHLAVKAGLSGATVGRIERDEFSPRLDTIEALAKALGTTVAELFAEPVEASA